MKYEWIVEIDDDEDFHLEEAKWKQELVRCKDCIRYAPFKDVDGVCLAHNTGVLIVMSQNGYCNLGERREDAETD